MPSLLDFRSSTTSESVAVSPPASPKRDMTVATSTRTGNAAGTSASTSPSTAQPQRSRQLNVPRTPSSSGSDDGGGSDGGGSDEGGRASAIATPASRDVDTARSQDARELAGLEAAADGAGVKRRLADFDVTLTFDDPDERYDVKLFFVRPPSPVVAGKQHPHAQGETMRGLHQLIVPDDERANGVMLAVGPVPREYLLPPTSRRERYRLQPGAGVNEPDLMLDIVLAGAPRWLTRPTFFEREFVAFGAEASAEGVRWEQPRFSVVFAPLAGATEAASEVWVDEVVTDAKWISERGVVVAAGSSLLLCGPPRATEGLQGFMDSAGRLPAPAVEIAVRNGSACKVACAVKGGMVVFTTVTDGRSNRKDPVILAEEKGNVGSVRWDPEDEHSLSYTVDNGHVAHIDTRQRPSAARRIPCFKGARTHTQVMSGGDWLVAGDGGRVALYDRRMGMSLAEWRDPLLMSVCDAHAHPATGKLVLFGHPGVTTWDISRSCTEVQGIAHGVTRAKRFSRHEVPPGFTEVQLGAAGSESAGGGDSNGVASKEGLCYGSLLASVQNEVLFGVVTAAPTGVVQIFRA